MIQHGILDLDAIYDMLGPDDSLIQESAEKEISEAREFIRKMNIVSTKDKEENEDKQQENEIDEDIKVRLIDRLMSLLHTNVIIITMYFSIIDRKLMINISNSLRRIKNLVCWQHCCKSAPGNMLKK